MAMIAGNLPSREMNAHGFTLVELMMAMTIMLLVMTGIYGTFKAQTHSWVNGQEIAGMQQNLRAGMYYLERSIRMAGFDPKNSKAFGFVSNLPAPYSGFGATTDSDDIAFTVDYDGDKVIDTNGDEQVAYRRNPLNNELQILDIENSRWEAVAQNISSVSFIYRDEDGFVTSNPSNIRTVQITLTAESGKASVTSTRSITSRVRCRNI